MMCDGAGDATPPFEHAAQVALPSLRHIEIECMLEEDALWFSQFLSRCDAPNLESMAIQFESSTLIAADVYQVVVRNQCSLPHA